jgi:hypothetical protein
MRQDYSSEADVKKMVLFSFIAAALFATAAFADLRTVTLSVPGIT